MAGALNPYLWGLLLVLLLSTLAGWLLAVVVGIIAEYFKYSQMMDPWKKLFKMLWCEFL